MLIYCICTQYLVGAPFALITASIRRGMEVISLWHCWGGMEAQVSLTVAFSSSEFFGFLFLIFLLTILSMDGLWGSGLVSLLDSQAHQHHGHLTNFWCFRQCGQVPNPAGKWNQHLFLPHFFLGNSTLWTASFFGNECLWLTLLVKGVNYCLLDNCQISSLPHDCVA